MSCQQPKIENNQTRLVFRDDPAGLSSRAIKEEMVLLLYLVVSAEAEARKLNECHTNTRRNMKNI